MTRFRIIYQNSNIDAPYGKFDIGRSLDCNLVLDDPSVSRIHATIVKEGGLLYLEDRGSRNGCTLNGTKVAQKQRVQLKDGDVIGIGHQSIKIAELVNAKRSAQKTMGLSACMKCGHWISFEDEFCSHCGQPKGNMPPSLDSMDTGQISTEDVEASIDEKDADADAADADAGLPDRHSGEMLAGLAQKALGKHKLDEAHKLTVRLMETLVKMHRSTADIPGDDLERVAALLVELAVQLNEPERINDIFVFFHKISRLIPRKTVEQLYKVARGIGYRTTSDMHAYLKGLATHTESFSPGEKFIYRRIEGLVGVCS